MKSKPKHPIDKVPGSAPGQIDWNDLKSTAVHCAITLAGAAATWLVDYGHAHVGVLATMLGLSGAIKFAQRALTDYR